MTLTFPSILSAQAIPLLSQGELDPYGLRRVWFHQLQLHSTAGKILNTFLEGGQLFITTSDAMLHVLDSETGQGLWSRSIGKRNLPLTEPAVNSRIVAVHNGLEIYLFHRKTGKELMRIPLPESASAPCELSEHYLYVPMDNQTVLIYILRESFAPQSSEGLHVDPPHVDSNSDPELAKIVKQFENAKRLLRAAEPVKTKEDVLVLDNTHRIPITSTAMGTLRTKPLLSSQFYTWVLDDEEQPTHEVDSKTHVEFVTWVTEQGYLYMSRITELSDKATSMLYRIDSSGQSFYFDKTQTIQIDRPGSKELLARPTQSQLYPVNERDPDYILLSDVIVTGGRAAYVFAIDARTGSVNWRYPTQGQLLESIAVIGRDVYAPTANGILHAIDLLTGNERWNAKNVKRFVASSKNRIYVLDQQKRLVALDRATGASIFVYDIRRFQHCLFNLETDQIFLLTDAGLVQCVREHQFSADGKDETSLRHRISASEFSDTVKGGEMPKLWWLDELKTEEEN